MTPKMSQTIEDVEAMHVSFSHEQAIFLAAQDAYIAALTRYTKALNKRMIFEARWRHEHSGPEVSLHECGVN